MWLSTALLAALASASPCPSITVPDAEARLPLAGRFCWLSGPADLEPEALLAHPERFAAAEPGQLRLPRTDEALWVRLELTSQGGPSSWALEQWTVPTDRATLYVFEDGRRVREVHSQDPPARTYYPLELQLPPGAHRTALVRVKSARVPVAPAALSSPRARADRDYKNQLVMGLFFGVGAALLLYNLFLFVALREVSYLAFVGFGVSLWGLVLGENGYVDLYTGVTFGPIAAPALGLVAAAAAAFTRALLGPGRPGWVRPALTGATAVNLGAALVASSGQLPPSISGAVAELPAVAAIGVMLASAGARAWQGDRPAQMYLLAWVGLFVPTLAWFAEGFGLIGQSLITRYPGVSGASILMILSSLALAERLSAARHAARAAAEKHAEALTRLLEEQAGVHQALAEAHARTMEISELRTQLLAKVSHELRTPLNHILGSAALLEHTGLDAEQTELTGHVAGAGRDLLTMVERLLDLADLESDDIVLSKDTIDVTALVHEAIEARRAAAEDKGLAIAVSAEPNLRPRIGDRTRLFRVLLELVDNAVRFTPAGGVRVTVRAERDGHVRVEVEDTGPGVPAATQDDLFSLFHQGDNSYTRVHGGLGVGLTLARRTVERLGGAIGFDSQAGRGARFWVRLPLAPAEA